MSDLTLSAIGALIGACGGIIGAVAGAVALLRQSRAAARQVTAQADNTVIAGLQDVIAMYNEQIEELMERMRAQEQKSQHDAEEISRLQKEGRDLRRELCEVRAQHAAEKRQWEIEREELLARLIDFERRLAEVSDVKC